VVRKAVIPAAGLGTRFLPVTKSQPKEMLPIVDKPALQFIIEEAVASGIESILLITGRGKRAIEDYFDKSYELENELKKNKKNDLLRLMESISDMAEIHYIRQREARGLGDAIRYARTFIGHDPFAILLGDDIIFSHKPVLKQLIEVYEQFKAPVLGVQKVERTKVHQYGIVVPETASENDRAFRLLDVVEKPPMDEAPSEIAILGRYIMTPELFDILDRTPPGCSGEIQLTDAIRQMIKARDVYACAFEGTRFDIGSKLDYIKATMTYALSREDLSEGVRAYLRMQGL
jgi:UTP--glucose-1-phosphate uridylyltransferase